jgi:hypothetical protein
LFCAAENPKDPIKTAHPAGATGPAVSHIGYFWFFFSFEWLLIKNGMASLACNVVLFNLMRSHHGFGCEYCNNCWSGVCHEPY